MVYEYKHERNRSGYLCRFPKGSGNKRLKKYGLDLAGSIFNAGMLGWRQKLSVNIRYGNAFEYQAKKTNAKNKKNKKYRRKATGKFNVLVYRYRGLIEGIFGAEETKHHHLYCKFIFKNNQKRFGLIKSIGWNLEVLSRLQCANKMGIKATPYAISN